MQFQGLLAFAAFMQRIVVAVGRVTAVCSIFMVLLTSAIVILRYGFDLGWIAMQESVLYLHAILFMLGAGYTLSQNEHVRVDIFYQKFSLKGRALVDFFGCLLLLLPVCGLIFAYSLDYVIAAWKIAEQSPESGGLPIVYLLKTLLLLMPVLLAMQGLAMMLQQLPIIFSSTDIKRESL